jgi:hypothetical protein
MMPFLGLACMLEDFGDLFGWASILTVSTSTPRIVVIVPQASLETFRRMPRRSVSHQQVSCCSNTTRGQGQKHECFVDENASGYSLYYEGSRGNKE